MDVINFQGGWIASLNNGETVYETPPVKGEMTSWQKLLERLRTEKFPDKNEKVVSLKMTGLRLQRGNLTITAMPQKMCDGYMTAYEVRKKFFASMGNRSEGESISQAVGSIVGDTVFLTWLEINNSDGNVRIYQDERPLDSCKVHTTLS